MLTEQPVNQDSTSLIDMALRNPLNPGEIGVLLARAGAGKTACLTHIALERLLRGQSVLHVCIDIMPDKIKQWYQEVLRNTLVAKPAESLAQLQQKIEPRRFILSYLKGTFSPGRLEQSLKDLAEQAKFKPALVVLDGLDFENTGRDVLEELKQLAKRHGVAMWMSARTHRHITQANERGVPYPCDATDDLFESIVLLEPGPEAIQITILKRENRYCSESPEVTLDPRTHLLQKG
jgi:hypothetical protein